MLKFKAGSKRLFFWMQVCRRFRCTTSFYHLHEIRLDTGLLDGRVRFDKPAGLTECDCHRT